MTISILYSDETLLVVNKPADLAIIPEGWDKTAPNLRALLEVEFGRVWVVHRLDKVTSGVVVFARSAEVHRSLSRQFEYHQANKIYHAIVCGVPAWDEESARQPLRGGAGHPIRTVVDWKKGKEAVTHFRVRERFAAHALLEASPETGRTHQIRAHAAALGFPILADSLYRAPPTDLIARPALHAHSLEFTHFAAGKRVTFSAPHPADFAAAVEALRTICNPKHTHVSRFA